MNSSCKPEADVTAPAPEIVTVAETQPVDEANHTRRKRAAKPANEVILSAGKELEQWRFMPVMSIDQALERRQAIVDATKKLMGEGTDYGRIPGTDRDVLLQPGADKLCNLFGLVIQYDVTKCEEDWSGRNHDGVPFFFYELKGRAYRGDFLMGEGVGSCNSWESKYRWRKAERLCPQCGKANIRKSRDGGWFCWLKTDGCGANFGPGDPRIEGQEVGRKVNPDMADCVNTILKMALKRCLGGAATVFMRVAGKVTRTDIDGLYDTWLKATRNDIEVPGIDGGWRTVKNMLHEENREVFRIHLTDGSAIPATVEHQFPTTRGLLHVAELKPGDSLLRSRICIPDGKADLRAAWVAGFFLAEGCYATNETTVVFSLHSKEADYVERIRDYADSVGCSTTVAPHGENGVTVTVSGPAFRGIMQTFIDGKGSYGKSISRRAWRQGSKFLDELLDGYLSGDGSESARAGHTDRWLLGFTGKNRDLAEDLRAICAVLGYRCSLKRSNARLRGIDFPAYKGWITRERALYHEKDLNEITAIEKADRPLSVYDIEVDGDHLFCLANGIHSHNCKVSTTINATSASEFFTQDMEDQQEAEDPKGLNVDTGSGRYETREVQEYLQDKKIGELRAAEAANNPKPSAEASELTGTKSGEIKQAFQVLRERIGEVRYLEELHLAGVTDPLQLRSLDKVRAFYRRLGQIAQLTAERVA
jgi:hypothetical protein